MIYTAQSQMSQCKSQNLSLPDLVVQVDKLVRKKKGMDYNNNKIVNVHVVWQLQTSQGTHMPIW